MLIAITQLAVSIILIILILLQERSAGLSGIFGGDGSGFYQTRRGAEKMIFIATIACALVFVALSIARLVL